MISPVKVWRHQKDIAKILGKKGRILSFTIVRVPPVGFKTQAPYPIVLIEVEGKERRIGQLVDFEDKDLKIGQKVEAVFRKMREPDREGVIPYGIKFKPV